MEWPVIPPALVRRFDPDVVVIADYPGSSTVPELAKRAGWERLTAIKGGRVFSVPAGFIKSPGPGASRASIVSLSC